jgi:hypothetical protein
MNPRMSRSLLVMVVAIFAAMAGCGPDYPDTSVDIPPRESSPGPYTPDEPEYQKETPRVSQNEFDCDVVIDEARQDFGQVYELVERPRIAILANVLTPNLGGRDDDQERVRASLQPGTLEAVPVDRATVENECINFFNSASERMKLVDVAVARTSMESATNDAGVLEGFRRIDLCDIAIMVEIRVNRVEPAQDHPANPERYAIACTARASNVRDGHVLTTASAERKIVTSEQSLNDALRKMSLCLSAELSSRLAERLSRPAP